MSYLVRAHMNFRRFSCCTASHMHMHSGPSPQVNFRRYGREGPPRREGNVSSRGASLHRDGSESRRKSISFEELDWINCEKISFWCFLFTSPLTLSLSLYKGKASGCYVSDCIQPSPFLQTGDSFLFEDWVLDWWVDFVLIISGSIKKLRI